MSFTIFSLPLYISRSILSFMQINELPKTGNLTPAEINDLSSLQAGSAPTISNGNNLPMPCLNTLKFVIDDVARYSSNQSGAICEGRQITLIGDGEKKIHKAEALEKVYDQVQILFKDGGKELNLDNMISEQFKKLILEIALNGKPDSKYCCVDFLMASEGLYTNAKVNHFIGPWQDAFFDESTIRTGDAIAMYGKDRHPVHFAIYLTNGIYLSVMGPTDKGITAMNLANMKTAYPQTDFVNKITYKGRPAIIADTLKVMIDSEKEGSLIGSEISLIGDGEQKKYMLETLGKVYKNVQILIRHKNEEINLNNKLSDEFKKAILNIVLNGLPDPYYTSMDLIMDARGLYTTAKVHQIEKWKNELFDESSIQTEEAIVMYDKNRNPFHYAIYLTKGIYLTVLGEGSHLTAMNLKEMRQFYPQTDEIYKFAKGSL